jgi:cell wall-associated NlpC family hydrolase
MNNKNITISSIQIQNDRKRNRVVAGFIILLISFLIIINACSPAARFSQNSGRDYSGRVKGTAHPDHGDSELWRAAKSWLNVPYKFGGTNRRGIDCSALSGRLYRDVFDIELPRTAAEQMRGGRFVRQPWLEEGDLLFFRDDRGSFQDHVGIYLGDGKFIHASSSQGVTISDLFSPYYQERLITARRYLE